MILYSPYYDWRFSRNFKDMIRKSATDIPSADVRSTEISAGMHERLVFMDFRCFFLGELRRTDLMGRFGIGTAAATRDIAYYRRVMGAKIQLEAVRKVYQPTKSFSPVFAHDVQRALAGLSRGFGETQMTKQRPLLPCEIPPQLCNPRVEIVAAITRAINQKRPVEVRYSSFSSGETTRQIVPYALADNGLRWHVRAFDRRRRQFIDLVLTRIHDVRERRTGEVDETESFEHDLEWGRVLELELVAHPKEEHPEIVAMDYNMKDGVVRVRVRAALASYLLRQWIVDCSPDHSLTDTEYRLWLRNTPILYGIANAHLAPGHRL
jgi:predicted DNA-binding transcriptional regulator YafY